MIRLIAFDADDTLWHNERIFLETKERFTALLREYQPAEWIEARLFDTEMRNLRHFGYGIKSFTLSMIETAIELTDGKIHSSQILEILTFAHDMINQPVNLLEHVEETVRSLSGDYPLAIVTKGDLFDQESKIAQSGLGDLFDHVEVVSEKDHSTYRDLLDRHGLEPSEFVMVGNSLKSDIIPVAEIGAHAIHVPYETTWKHEEVPRVELDTYRFVRAASIKQVPELIAGLGAGG